MHFGRDVDDLCDETLHLAAARPKTTHREIPPDQVTVGMDELLGHPVGLTASGQNFLGVLDVDLPIVRSGQVLPGLRAQGLGVIAEEGAQGRVDRLENAVGRARRHADPGVVDQPAPTGIGFALHFAGLGEESGNPEPIGDIAPGEVDQRRGDPGGSQVVAAGVGENLVVVGEIVHDHRFAGVQTLQVLGEQSGPGDTRCQLQQTVAEEVLAGQAEVVTRRLVEFAVDEIGDRSAVVRHRFQQHLRVQHRIATGAQQIAGTA